MRIIFFNRFFFPDPSATSQMVSDLALHLARAGNEVHAVASRSGNEAPVREMRGITVHRAADAGTESLSLPARAGAYLRHYRGARAVARKLLARGDVVIVKTDPPLLSAAIGPIAASRGARVVVWLQDLFPEVASEYGVPGIGGILGSPLRAARDRSLGAADRVVAIGDRMAARIVRMRCVAPERLHVIHNWADGRAITALAAEANPLRAAWGMKDHFVVGYSGNLGRVHEFDTLLDAAILLRGDSNIRFLIIGRGARLPQVRKRVDTDRLSNVLFAPHQDRELLGQSLCVPDVHLCVLRPNFEGLVVPSKLYGGMASGRPTIFVGSPEGEAAAIIGRAQGGFTVSSGDAAGLARAIRRLRDAPDERRLLGAQARRAFEREYDLPVAMRHWENVLALSVEASAPRR
ncbi:MAG: glycosyltransferase family 4 protein [Usitatibacter sp.]